MIEVSEYFKMDYLTCGQTRDNFLFENCPKEFVLYARKCLCKAQDNVKPCIITITPKLEKDVEKTLIQCKDDLQKSFFARDLICSIFMHQMLKGNERYERETSSLYSGIRAILNGDIERAIEYHTTAPMPYEVTQMARKIGKIEVNVFLIDTKNKFVQQAINNFISSREPYSIKVFTTTKSLPSYRDQLGNIVQSPHDYMTIDVNKYITINESMTK